MKNFDDYKDAGLRQGLSLDSKVVHGATGIDPVTGAISFPIYQTATYKHHSITDRTGYNYSRCINPTREEVERTMCILEGGARAYAVSSGMAAIMLTLSILKPGDHVVCSDDVYGGTSRAVKEVLAPMGVSNTSVDLSVLPDLMAALRPETRMIFIETPTNPMMKVADIAAIAAVARERGILTVVDNTFLTPYFQRPLTLGADIVIHSGTKYLAGHNDTLAGIVVLREPELGQWYEIRNHVNGAGLGPMDSWLLLRGMKTLALRMRRHNDNAVKVANWLRNHPKVEKVYFVGFDDHPGREITDRQTTGFGGTLSFRVDSMETVDRILDRVRLVTFAESLGGVESLITHPVSRTHTEVSEADRLALGITDTLLRLSVGIEDPDDIIADLEQAMA